MDACHGVKFKIEPERLVWRWGELGYGPKSLEPSSFLLISVSFHRRATERAGTV